MEDKKFDEIYQKIINSSPKDMSEKAKISGRNSNLSTLLIGIDVVLMFLCFYSPNFMQGNYIVYLLIGVGIFVIISIVIIIKLNKKVNNFTGDYKKYVITPIIKNVWPDADYDPDAGLDEKDYNKDLYDEYYEDYYTEDYIGVKNKHLILAHILLQKTETDSDGDSHTVTVFTGFAGNKVLDKNIKSNFKIVNNGLFNNNVKVDSKEFEKAYDLIADDKIKAMEFLTPDVMEKILSLHNDYNYDFEFGIENNMLFFRVETYEDFCDYKSKDIFNKETIYAYYALLNTIDYLVGYINNVVNDMGE